MPERIFISGANGFIGAVLCRYFLTRGEKVTAILGPSRKNWRLPTSANIEQHSLDLSNQSQVQEFVSKHQPKIFLHCAAFGAYSNQTKIDDIYRINFNVVRYLLEALSKVEGFCAFVQAGSQSEYGFNCSGPKEDDQVSPDSDYAVSKVACTTLVRYYAQKHKMPAWIFRLYSVYGYLEDGERLIPRMLAAANNNSFPKLVAPDISRDFVFVEDVCEAYQSLLARRERLAFGEIYNIGSGRETTMRDLVRIVQRQFGVSAKPEWNTMASRGWDHSRWYSNPAKAKEKLGWSAKTSLEEGLALTMNWVRDNPALAQSAVINSVFNKLQLK